MWLTLASLSDIVVDHGDAVVCNISLENTNFEDIDLLEFMARPPPVVPETNYNYVNCLVDHYKISESSYVGPNGANFVYGLYRIEKTLEFNKVVLSVADACKLTQEERVQFWAIMTQEAGASLDLKYYLRRQGMYGIAQVNPRVWLTSSSPGNPQIQRITNYLHNTCDFSKIKNDLDPAILQNNRLKTDYTYLRDSILRNTNHYSSVILGLGIYKEYQSRLIETSSNATIPFTLQMFQKWDHTHSINAMFAIGYEYHTPNIIRDGIRLYTTHSGVSRNYLNTTNLERAKQKVNHYLAYKHYTIGRDRYAYQQYK